MERTLRTAEDDEPRAAALAILRRWRYDSMLDDASRRKAEALVTEFGNSLWFRQRKR